MPKETGLVCTELVLKRVGYPLGHYRAEMLYDRRDPYAVRFDFGNKQNGETVLWDVSRDIIAAAHANKDPDVRLGMSDVVLRTHAEDSSQLIIDLKSNSGEIALQVPRAPIGKFLRRTNKLVPPGTEEMVFMHGIDTFIKDVLDKGE